MQGAQTYAAQQHDARNDDAQRVQEFQMQGVLKQETDLERDIHPLSSFGLDMLARGAARLRGRRLAVSEAGAGAAGETLTYSDLDRCVGAFAARALECGLAAGDRVLVIGAARASVIVAIFGALHARLEPVIAPAHMSAGALAFLAQSTGATAIFGPTILGSLNMEPLLLEAAGAALDIRLVGTLGPGGSDGAIDFSTRALPVGEADRSRSAVAPSRPRIGMVQRGEGRAGRAPNVVFTPQSAIVAQALELIGEMGLSAERPLVSTLSPASAVGFLAGPVSALLAGAPLTLFSPFDATGFVLLLDRLGGPCHLVAPERIWGLLEDAGMAGDETLESLTLACDGAECKSALSRPNSRMPIIRLATNAEGRIIR